MLRKAEQLRQNGKLYGCFMELDSGFRYYMAYRKHGEIFRNGEKSISEAISKGKAAWALDVVTLGEIRARGIKLVCIHIKETGEEFFTTVDNFYDSAKIQVMNFSKRGGALQRYLPLAHFRRVAGKMKL